MKLGRSSFMFVDKALENCLSRLPIRAAAIFTWPGPSSRLCAAGWMFFSLFLGAGAWGIFAASEATFGWQISALVAIVYLIAIAGFQVVLVDRLSAAFRRLEAERAEALRLGAERDTVHAEAQHRIGNSLSVISAMLSVQARQLSDRVARHAIAGAAGRVRAIAEINRMITKLPSEDMRLDDAFVRELVAKCIAAVGAEERVRYETSIEPIDLPERMLLPVALVLTECVNNALEHGFPGDACGAITIRLEGSHDERGDHRLTIADDGPGPPAGFDATKARSAGLMLVNSFALQVGGSFRLEGEGRGARSVLTF